MGSSWLRQRVLVLVLVLVMVTSAAIELTEDHVCSRVENYTVTFKETYMEPVVVNTFSWCLQIPPRCPQSQAKMRERWRIKTEIRQRELMDCCEGYVVVKATTGIDSKTGIEIGKCEPHCDNQCLHGHCIAPNTCECEPNYFGDDCSLVCLEGTWGERCSKQCNCHLGTQICDRATGTCLCKYTGFTGPRCTDECPVGTWGYNCSSSCDCTTKGYEDLPFSCDPITGKCPVTADERTSEQLRLRSLGFTLSNLFEEKKTTEPTTSTTIISSTARKSMSTKTIERSTLIKNYDRIGNDRKFGNNDNHLPDYKNDYNNNQREESSISSKKTISEISLDSVVPEIITIETSPIATSTSTSTNKNGNYNEQEGVEMRIGTIVPRVKEPSTPRPIVAVVHVSGNESPDHDAPIIMTSLGTEKIPTHVVPMPLDIAALIVVGSILSLGLTILAVLAVLHIRSKLFETIRLSIYDTEKGDTINRTVGHGGGEKGNATRISSMTSNTGILDCEYETPRCMVPEHRTLTRPRPPSRIDVPKKQESSYSNDYRNIQLFNNLQELLEAHYDRPPSTFRHAVCDVDGEHVYDEIPLQNSTTFATKSDSEIKIILNEIQPGRETS